MEKREENPTLVFFIAIISYICLASALNLLIYCLLFLSKQNIESIIYGVVLIEFICVNIFIENNESIIRIKKISLFIGLFLPFSYFIIILIAFHLYPANTPWILASSLLLSILSLFIMYLICCKIEKKKDFEIIKNDILANQSGMPAEERLKLLAEEYDFKVSDFLKIPLINNLIFTKRKSIYR